MFSLQIVPVWPVSVCLGANVFMFHTMIVLSREAEAKSSDSNRARHVTPAVCLTSDFLSMKVAFCQTLIVESSEADTKSLLLSSISAVISFR